MFRIVQAAKLRRKMTRTNTIGGDEGERNTTEMRQAITLIWIAVLYVICQSPKIIPDFYEALHCEYSEVRILLMLRY